MCIIIHIIATLLVSIKNSAGLPGWYVDFFFSPLHYSWFFHYHRTRLPFLHRCTKARRPRSYFCLAKAAPGCLGAQRAAVRNWGWDAHMPNFLPFILTYLFDFFFCHGRFSFRLEVSLEMSVRPLALAGFRMTGARSQAFCDSRRFQWVLID